MDGDGGKRGKARALLDRMMGERFGRAIKEKVDTSAFGAALSNRAIEFVFADTWCRPGLDLKTRSIKTLSIQLAQGRTEEFRNHVAFDIDNGLTVEEIEELLIQAVPYAGLPAATACQNVAIEALRAEGMLQNALTSRERGLYVGE